MSKTITINKKTLLVFLLSLVLGFGILFLIEHFGKFNSTYYPVRTETDYGFIENTPSDTPLLSISYHTPFGSEVKTSGNGFTIFDMKYKDVGLNLYENKIYYILNGLKTDFLYGLLFSTIIFVITIFFKNFKIKVK